MMLCHADSLFHEDFTFWGINPSTSFNIVELYDLTIGRDMN